MPQDGVRTFLEGPWHYCHRCGRKTKLDSELQWQYSKLLCFDCYDQWPVLVGSIEMRQAEALKGIVNNPDMRPNEKLINPTVESSEDEILL